jgi:FdhE protein
MLETGRWSERRRRAENLVDQWPFAAEVLAFYLALLDVQQRIFDRTREAAPDPDRIAEFAAEVALPYVVQVSIDRGPEQLGLGVVERFHATDAALLVENWLRGHDLAAVDRYLARASVAPILEALDQNALARMRSGEVDDRHCPACGGLPQVSYFASGPEDLVTGHRYLLCSRCAGTWAYTRMSCASCGEDRTEKLVVYSEIGTLQGERSNEIVRKEDPNVNTGDARFPHLRIDGCTTCRHYLINVDLGRDGRAVPEVDELAALPLDLYAKERGLTKIAPNLMGF